MARIFNVGPYAKVELDTDPIEGGVIATCVERSISDGRLAPAGNCSWTERYDDWNDAVEYSADHADTGDQR